MSCRAEKRVYANRHAVGVLLSDGNWYTDAVLLDRLNNGEIIIGLTCKRGKLSGTNVIPLSKLRRVTMGGGVISRKERYRVYENDILIGFFTIVFSLQGREFTMDLNTNKTRAFILMPDENGHITHEKIKSWLKERIVPPTRDGIEWNLKEMGLSEYDELEILKYTSGKSIKDTGRIDFSEELLKGVEDVRTP